MGCRSAACRRAGWLVEDGLGVELGRERPIVVLERARVERAHVRRLLCLRAHGRRGQCRIERGHPVRAGTRVAGVSGTSGRFVTGTNGGTLPSPDQSGRRKPVTGQFTPCSEWTVTPNGLIRALIVSAVAEVDADVRAVVVDHEIAALRLRFVRGHLAAAGEIAHVAGGPQSRAADAVDEPGVAEGAEDEARAVEQRWPFTCRHGTGRRGTAWQRR